MCSLTTFSFLCTFCTCRYVMVLALTSTLKKQWIILLLGMNHIIHLEDNKDKKNEHTAKQKKSWSCTVLIEYGKNYEKRFWMMCNVHVYARTWDSDRVRANAISFATNIHPFSFFYTSMYGFVHKLFTFLSVQLLN